VLVVLVLFVLLGDARSALIVTVTLPLSVVLAGIAMRWFGAGINTMTLGGLARADEGDHRYFLFQHPS
jgi:cobalt-zinc-cadmium resistance protein CzcA